MQSGRHPRTGGVLPPRILRHAALAGMTVLILAALAWRVEWRALGAALSAGDAGLVAASSALCLLFPLLNAVRWLAVLRALGIDPGFARTLRITLAVWPVGTLTPAKAGEFLKAAAIRDLAPMPSAMGSALSERVVDVGVLGALGLAGGIASHSPPAACVGGAALLAAALAVPALHFAERFTAASDRPLARKLSALAGTLPALVRSPRHLALCAGASAVNWGLSIVQLHLLLSAFGSKPSLAAVTGALPAATFAGLLPVTIAGAGTRDAALAVLLSEDPARLLAAGVVYTLTGYFGLGIVGLPFLGELRRNAAANADAGPR